MVEQGYTDTEIIQGCIAGQRKMQEYLYKKYYSSFMKICMRYANDIPDAEHYLNDGFFKIFTKLEQYNNAGSFEGWMKRIMINTCLDKLKAKKTLKNFDTVDIADYGPEYQAHTINDAIPQMSFNEIMRSLQCLPENYRVVFNLNIFEGYSHKEIAQMLSIKEGTSHWYLNKAREMLKQELMKYQLKSR